MLFNNLTFLPGLAFFRRGLAFFSKGVWQLCGCQHSYSQRQKLSTASEANDRFATNQTDISVELQSLYESNTTYVRCYEIVYISQQNVILQSG